MVKRELKTVKLRKIIGITLTILGIILLGILGLICYGSKLLLDFLERRLNKNA